MTTQLQRFNLKKYNLIMSTPHPYKLPVLRQYDSLDKTWYVEYYVYSEQQAKLKRKRVVLAEPTEAARLRNAKTIISDITKMLKQGAIVDPVRSRKIISSEIKNTSSIIAAITHYLESSQTTIEENTYNSYKQHLDHLINFLHRHNIHNISLQNFQIADAYKFVDELKNVVKHGNRTRNNVKDSCSIFYNYYIKRKILTENPFVSIPNLRSVAKKYTAISKEHVKLLLSEFEKQNQQQLSLFVYFEYYAALRPNRELRLLKISDILDQTIAVPFETSKTKEKEHVRIPPPLEKKIVEAKLRSYPSDYYVFSKNSEPGPGENGKKYQYIRHREILRTLNLDHLNYDIYSWKHSGVIALFLATKNLELVRQHCRHKDIATTIKYMRDLGQFVDYEEINKFPEI